MATTLPADYWNWTDEERAAWAKTNGGAPWWQAFNMPAGWGEAREAKQNAFADQYRMKQILGQGAGAAKAFAKQMTDPGVISGPGGINPGNPYKSTPAIPGGTISGPGGQNPYSQPLRMAASGGGFSPMSGTGATTYNPYMNRRRTTGGFASGGGGFSSGFTGGGMGGGLSGLTRSY
jgi:hypothetical protein